MAALTVCLCSVVEQIWHLTDAFVQSGCDVRQTWKRFRAKERDFLFRQCCREAWLRSLANYAQDTQRQQLPPSAGSEVNHIVVLIPVSPRSSVRRQLLVTPGAVAAMRRAGIDFAAIEAGAEAYEVIDTFGAHSPSSPRAGRDADLFLTAERHHFEVTEVPLDYDDIEVVDGVEIDTSFYEYLDKLPVYHNNNIPKLREGVSYTFNGYIVPNCERFSINFANAVGDVALHINPRLPQNYIVRNTKVSNTWGREEVSSPLPFTLHRGSKFSIQVLATDACYMISVNGHHFVEYSHRLPYGEVNTIEVKGDVEHVEVERHEVEEYPDRLPQSLAKEVRLVLTANQDEVDGKRIPHSFRMIRVQSVIATPNGLNSPQTDGLRLPYYGRIPAQSLAEGRCIKIRGRVKLLPHSFYINLQQGQNIWPHPLVAFHFNPRFSKQSGAIGKAIVCRNAWYQGKWAQEERSELDTDFRPGKTFCLTIVCLADAFEVYVNRKYITQFKYHIKPDCVDIVYIQGDIKLWEVTLENSATLSEQRRIIQNPIYSEEDE